MKPWVSLFFSAVLLLTGCTDPKAQWQYYLKAIKANPVKALEPIPKFTALPDYRYSESLSRLNPFKKREVVKRQFSTDPLQAFPLQALKLIGILEQSAFFWAFVELPNKEISRIKTGDNLGKNSGEVITITKDAVIIKEMYQIAGKPHGKITVLHLEKDGAASA